MNPLTQGSGRDNFAAATTSPTRGWLPYTSRIGNMILSGGKWWRLKSCGCCVEEVK